MTGKAAASAAGKTGTSRVLGTENRRPAAHFGHVPPQTQRRCGLRNLTNSPGADLDPAWSPDGKQIAFTSNRVLGYSKVFVMRSDGSDVQQLTYNGPGDFDPAWAPNERRVAYDKLMPDGTFDIWAVDAGRTNDDSVTRSPRTSEFDPTWSPDGKRLAFARRTGSNYDIWTAGAIFDDKERRLTTDPAEDASPARSPAGDVILAIPAKRPPIAFL